MDDKMRERVVELLLADSRRSLRSMARELGVSTTTVGRIVSELEGEGVVLGYTAAVDWHKLGYDNTICLQIGVSPRADINKVGRELKRNSAVKQVFYTTGDTNISAYAVCRDTVEAAEVLERVRRTQGVEKVVSHTVLKVF